METGLAGNHCHGTSHKIVPPRHATPGFCLRPPFTGALHRVFLLYPRHSTNVLATFSRALQSLEVLQELVPIAHVEGAREL